MYHSAFNDPSGSNMFWVVSDTEFAAEFEIHKHILMLKPCNKFRAKNVKVCIISYNEPKADIIEADGVEI